ncbi:MAG: sigma-70 family RNA polymerase sigma factor [Pirellulales bacterium]
MNPRMKELLQTSPGTSESLIARIKDPADAAAWEEFAAIYRPVIYRMARRRMQDADAQDVVQKVLLAVSQSVDRWSPGKGQPPFRAWLVTISKNAILNAVTRRRPDMGNGSTSIVELLHQQADDDPQTSAEFLLETRREAIRWATREIRPEFSENTWQLFWETAVVGRTAADVAHSSARTVGAVYMARFKVMQRLKEKIAEVSLS